jgi:hypothetical protein
MAEKALGAAGLAVSAGLAGVFLEDALVGLVRFMFGVFLSS